MLDSTADHLAAGLFVADSEGKVIFVNERWSDMTGLSPAEALGDGWKRGIHPDDLAQLESEWLEAVKTRRLFFGRARFLHADGRTISFEAEGSPLDLPGYQAGAYIGSCTDISARHQSEAHARLYEALLSNNPDFAYVFDTQHRVVYANQSLLTMWGKTWDETIGKGFREVGYPEWHAAMHEREIDTVVATRLPFTGEIHFDGTHGRRLYEYIFTPIFNKEGTVEAIAGATRDITERKQIEDRANFLSGLSGRLMTLSTEAEIVTEAVSMLGRHLNVQRCYFIECLRDENLLRVAPDWCREGEINISGDYPLDSFGGEEWWRRCEDGSLAVENVETDPLTALNVGSYRNLGLSSYATQPYRRIGRWSVVLAVTESSPRIWTEEEIDLLDNVAARVWPLIEQSRGIESLREADRRKDQFLATLAHELRNPLAPVLTGLEIMRRANGDAAMIEGVTGIIERQTRQMAHLINDLLDISRVNTGKIILRKEDLPFKQILENAIEASQPLLTERHHQFTAQLPPDSVVITADPSRIAQVISNLLSNAAKYTPVGGRISLESGIQGTDAWIRVADNGQGIDPKEQNAIFELFHQIENGSSDGLGLGLTLVRSLMQMHGGHVTVRSEGGGQGSAFEIYLPACVVSSAASPHLEESSPLLTGALRALIVDDSRSNADMLAMLLELDGLEVEVAYDGLEGLEKARVFAPDVVIMDLGMPVMDGLEAAARMRAEKLAFTLIAVSGWGRDEDRKNTAEAGFDHHLTKPVNPAELRTVLAGIRPAATRAGIDRVVSSEGT